MPVGEPLTTPELLAPLLDGERLGLITDFDGTISAIALRPEGAVASPVAREALATLAKHLTVVGAMSGRALFDLRAKLDLPALLYIGSHGLTWWYQGLDETPEEALPYVDLARRAGEELAPLRQAPGIRFEEKGVGLALHYRQAPDPDAARAAILSSVAASPTAQHFEVREGILVAELYPRIKVNKGTALRRVAERFALDAVIFLGDDLTDVDAMFAARAMRGEGGLRAATVAVRHPEAPPLVAEAADWVVEGIAGSERVLTWLAAEAAARWPEPGAGGGVMSPPRSH